jgi:hypothetical protein
METILRCCDDILTLDEKDYSSQRKILTQCLSDLENAELMGIQEIDLLIVETMARIIWHLKIIKEKE